jgi:glucose 1-dehydrogenase
VRTIEAAGGEAVAIAADVSQEDQVASLMVQAMNRFGTVHVMVPNAGIERPAAIQDISLYPAFRGDG